MEGRCPGRERHRMVDTRCSCELCFEGGEIGTDRGDPAAAKSCEQVCLFELTYIGGREGHAEHPGPIRRERELRLGREYSDSAIGIRHSHDASPTSALVKSGQRSQQSSS